MNDTLKITIELPKRTILRLAMEAHEESITLESLLQRELYRRANDGTAEEEAEMEAQAEALPEGSVQDGNRCLDSIDRLRA